MIGLLKKIVGLCDHKWVAKWKSDIIRNADSKKVGTQIISECSKCGAFKKWNLR